MLSHIPLHGLQHSLGWKQTSVCAWVESHRIDGRGLELNNSALPLMLQRTEPYCRSGSCLQRWVIDNSSCAVTHELIKTPQYSATTATREDGSGDVSHHLPLLACEGDGPCDPCPQKRVHPVTAAVVGKCVLVWQQSFTSPRMFLYPTGSRAAAASIFPVLRIESNRIKSD